MKKYKVIIWGLGEIGSVALYRALQQPNIELVGVKVFSDTKHGKDVGELIGICPVGINATQSKQEILAMEADCVVYTPRLAKLNDGQFIINENLDRDTLDLLESGKSVVTTTSYQNLVTPNWASPQRPSAQRFKEACEKGGSSLLGTGIHPDYISERLVASVAHMITDITHIRTVEALNFSRAPDDMWGHPSELGFGLDPNEITSDIPLAKGNIMYYTDMAGNLAENWFPDRNSSDIRLEVNMFGIPAEADYHKPDSDFVIPKGKVAAIHQEYKFYFEDKLFFTNDEFWWMGRENGYLGDSIQLADAKDCLIDYFVDVEGKPANIRARYKFEPTDRHIPAVANVSAMLMLDAISKVCDSEPGVLVDDVSLRYKLDKRIQ